MSAPTLQIGPVTVSPGLILAPMSGVTNTCFRKLVKRENPGAVGLLVTEFISIEALTRNSRRSLEMAEFSEGERPISIQIFGYQISRMVQAAQMMEARGADIIDINCGCPVPKVVRKGGGCELMRQPAHLEKMLRAVKKAISIPLTLKIRAGWDNETRNALDIARLAEDAGVSMLAIHGRTRTEMYRGSADWDIVSAVADAISIPVVGSGDVIDAHSAKERLAKGVSGLMIGRAALANPWVFSEIQAALEGREFTRPGDTKTVDLLEDYLKMLLDDLPEKAVLGRMKQLASQVTRRVRGSKQARKSLCRTQTIPEFSETLKLWREHLETRVDSDSEVHAEYESRLFSQSC